MLKVNNIQNFNKGFVRKNLNNDINNENKSNLSFTSNVVESESKSLEEKEKKEKKNKFSIKNLTNVLGTVAGLGIIIGAAYYMNRRPDYIKRQAKEGALAKKLEALKVDYECALNTLKEGDAKEKKGGFLYRAGSWIQNKVDTIGSELTNNIIYAIGTLAVMPPVIMWSPFGKKNSTKEDKLFAVIRQPVSFATMFSIQLTGDKVISRWQKAAENQNLYENPEIVENGKIKPGTPLEKIRYNADKFKENFKNVCEDIFGEHIFESNKSMLNGIENKPVEEQKDLIKNLLKELNLENRANDELLNIMDDTKMPIEVRIKKLLGKSFYVSKQGDIDSIYKVKSNVVQHEDMEAFLKGLNLSQDKFDKLMSNFEKYVNAAGRKKLVGEAIKIASNVLISQVIGCTLLNVAYGKIMKAREHSKANQLEKQNYQEKINQLVEANNLKNANKIEGMV